MFKSQIMNSSIPLLYRNVGNTNILQSASLINNSTQVLANILKGLLGSKLTNAPSQT